MRRLDKEEGCLFLPNPQAPMNTERIARKLCQNLERLPYLPFVTDEELGERLDPEVIQAFRLLESLNRAQGICYRCGGKCCHEMGCELFSPELGGCPIADYRPLLCRFHYCEKFGPEHEGLVKGLRDLFVSAAAHGEAESRVVLGLELNMLLYRACRKPDDHCPHLVENMRQIAAAAHRGEMSWQEAKGKFREEVETYRSMKQQEANLALAGAD